MSARDMAARLLDRNPATFAGQGPGFPVYPGHRSTWILEAFTVLRELGLVPHANTRAWLDALNAARWDITGSGDPALWAWHSCYEQWAEEQAAENAAIAAAKRGDA